MMIRKVVERRNDRQEVARALSEQKRRWRRSGKSA
jgi:hypothetical protein